MPVAFYSQSVVLVLMDCPCMSTLMWNCLVMWCPCARILIPATLFDVYSVYSVSLGGVLGESFFLYSFFDLLYWDMYSDHMALPQVMGIYNSSLA